MKKKLLLILVLLLAPILVLAENVSIKSVKLVDKSKYVEELSEPIFEGLKMAFNLKFNSVGDNATYELVVKNDDSENYFLNLEVDSDSKYILYELDSEETTNVIKEKSETKIYVVVKYNKEVPNYMLENNKYTETKDLGIKLTNNKGEEVIVELPKEDKEETTKNVKVVVNPNTGNIVMKLGKTNIAIPLYVVVLVLGVSIGAIILIKRNKVGRYTMILLVLLSVPVMINALKEIKIIVTSNIEIEKVNLKTFTFRNYYDYVNLSKYKSKKYDFEEGMTFEEWLESKYNVDNIIFNNEEYDGVCLPGYFYKKYGYSKEDGELERKEVPKEYLIGDFSDVSFIGSLADVIEEDVFAIFYQNCEVKFTITDLNNNKKEYNVPFGMTWGEWLNSEYNVDNLEFEDAGIVTGCRDSENRIFINYYYGSERYKKLILWDDYVLGSFYTVDCRV